MKEITDKLGFIKIREFCTVKDTVKRMWTETTDWGKYLQKGISNKGPLSKIYYPQKYNIHYYPQKLLKPDNKQINKLTEKEAKDPSTHVTR